MFPQLFRKYCKKIVKIQAKGRVTYISENLLKNIFSRQSKPYSVTLELRDIFKQMENVAEK